MRKMERNMERKRQLRYFPFLLHFPFFGPGYCRNENEKQRKGGKTRKRNRVGVRVRVKGKRRERTMS